jgi:O-antigen ligase
MWKEAINFTSYNWSNSPKKVIFGLGVTNYPVEFKEYISIKNEPIAKSLDFSFTDPHNGYLDNILKHGFLYEILFILLLLHTAYQLLYCSKEYKESGICVISHF